MANFESLEDEISRDLVPQNIARLALGEFGDDNSEGEYAPLTPPDLPPHIGGIALNPPGEASPLSLDQSR